MNNVNQEKKRATGRKKIHRRLKTHPANKKIWHQRWKIIEKGWHSWASSKSDSKHVNKANWKPPKTLHVIWIWCRCSLNDTGENYRKFWLLYCVYESSLSALSPVFCVLFNFFFSDFKRIMSIRKRRYFQRIKLTQNALSISPQKFIFGFDHIHYWTFFLLIFTRGKKKLNDYYFRLFDQHHIWIIC